LFNLKIKAFENGLEKSEPFKNEKNLEVLNTIKAQISDPKVQILLGNEFEYSQTTLKSELLKAIDYVIENYNNPTEKVFQIEFKMNLNSDLKTLLNPSLTVKRATREEHFVTINDPL